ncbi:MAG: hypothetical protein R2708_25170 [Vicinamibacterales bacterium]
MVYVLALVAVTVTLLLAYRGFLHPGDYLVESGLAFGLALFVVVLTPSVSQHAQLLARGAPASAVERSAFLLANGVSIELASVVIALGALAAAAVRGKAFGGWRPSENHG